MNRQFRNLKFGDKFMFPSSSRLMQKERGCSAVNAFGPANRQQVFPGVLVRVVGHEEFAAVATAVKKARNFTRQFPGVALWMNGLKGLL